MGLGSIEKKQYRPIPEEPKPGKKHNKQHRRYLLERKLKPEHFQPGSLFGLALGHPDRWDHAGFYGKAGDALKAKESMKHKYIGSKYDYQVIDQEIHCFVTTYEPRLKSTHTCGAPVLVMENGESGETCPSHAKR
jgi:hypothetical protein